MDKKLSKEAYGGVSGKDYVPYISSGSRLGGNIAVLIIGILLAALFAASTAYSGMKAGLTVAAGIGLHFRLGIHHHLCQGEGYPRQIADARYVQRR